MDSQWTHNGLTKDSHRIHNGLTKDSLWTHTDTHHNIVFTLIFGGYPGKLLFLHLFYRVVREKACFYIGFTRLSTNNVVFTMEIRRLSTKNLVKPV